MRTIVLIVTASFLAVGLPSAVHGAGAHRYTRGDAEAMLNNYPPGKNIFERLPTGLDIRPFDFYGDISYCVEDWHVIALLWDDYEYVLNFDDGSRYVHNHSNVVDFLRGIRMQFLLDGVPVEVSKMPIKPYLSPGAVEGFEGFVESELGVEATVTRGWAVQAGRVLAPAELGVGTHTLAVIATHPEQFFDPFPSPYSSSVTFTVSPPDSVACTEAG